MSVRAQEDFAPLVPLRLAPPAWMSLGFALLVGFARAPAAEPIIAVVPLPGATAPAEAPEYNIKAGYLRLFARYTEWPPDIFTHASDPVVVGVLGANPFGEILQGTLQGLKIQNRSIEVRLVQTVEEAALCQVVFIARRQEHEEAAWLNALRDKPVLTVTESEQGLARGAVLALAYEKTARGPKVVFDASLRAARQAGLKLSADMLQSTRKILLESGEIKATR